MKEYVIIFGLLFGGFLMGQTLSWTNPSFEGTAPGSSVSPPGWSPCNGSPDTQPGCWGTTLAASQGSSYVGMVYALSIPTSQESAGQALLAGGMTAGTPYSISMRLVNLDIYNGSWNGGAVVNIYGASSNCNFSQQLLWTSGSFVNSTWQTFNALFTPTSSWSHFIIRVHPGVSSTWPAIGMDNLLSNAITPVKLTHFGASTEDDAAHIDWQTSEEMDMESYTVQRADGYMDFQDVETVPATGNGGSSQSYRVIDTDLPQGLTYYRLRMNDRNCSSTLSEIRQVLYSTSGKDFALKTLFPNPADALARLEIVSLVEQDAKIAVLDVSGHVVHEETHTLLAGENRIELPTQAWLAGAYHVQIRVGAKAVTKSFLVAH